jgi:hypothetical protein
MSIRLGIYIAVAVAFLGLGGFAGCEHKAAKQLRVDLDTARAANASNIVTLDTQAKALQQWKALHKTPEEVTAIVSNAKAYVDEIDRLSRQIRMYREKDQSIDTCVKLLAVSLSTCPGRTAILHNFAHGGHADD